MGVVGLPRTHLGRARRIRLVWCIAAAPLVLAMLLPVEALAGAARSSSWSTETIPAPTAAPVAHDPVATPPPVRELNAFELQAAETIKITNAFRRRNGLPEFVEDPVCTAAAFDHAQDMARRGYFDHFGPGGISPTIRYQRRNTAGQRVIRVTENIARGNGTTPESALKMWLNSSGHRKHLVGREMNHIGVGVANGRCFFDDCTYFVQCFSRWPS
jgi:uncharacterized protein YkwD